MRRKTIEAKHRAWGKAETGNGRPEEGGKAEGVLVPKRRSVKNFGFVKHQKKILSDDQREKFNFFR